MYWQVKIVKNEENDNLGDILILNEICWMCQYEEQSHTGSW